MDKYDDDILWQRMAKRVTNNRGEYTITAELLEEWEEVRLRINPNAKKFDLLRYE